MAFATFHTETTFYYAVSERRTTKTAETVMRGFDPQREVEADLPSMHHCFRETQNVKTLTVAAAEHPVESVRR